MTTHFVTADECFQQDERIKWCLDNIVGVYPTRDIKCEISADGKLIIHGDIIIQDEFEELPIKIDEVYGDVYLSNSYNKCYGSLKTLHNFPDVIHGKLDCRMNRSLTSLKDCPRQIDGSLWCNNCSLSNLDGISDYIGGHLLAFSNNIIDISAIEQCKLSGYVVIDPNPIVNTSDSVYKKLRLTKKIVK